MTSDYSCVVALSRGDLGQNIINEWQNEVQTLRAIYGTDQVVNALHASKSNENAAKYVIKNKNKYF